MDGCNWSAKKITLHEKMDDSSQSPKRSQYGQNNEWPVANILFKEWTHYFKEWTTASGVLKKLYCLYKNLMLQIDPLNNSGFQKLQYPEKKLRLYVLRKSGSLEILVVSKVTLASANICNCSFKKFTMLNEQLQLLLWNCQINTFTRKEWDGCKCFRAFKTVLFKQILLQLVLWNK